MPPILIWIFSVGMIVLNSGVVSGQNYPNKPIRIVSADIGGNTDFNARIVAQGLASSLGQPVIVDNRPNGVIPGEIVTKALPDGYTLLVYSDIVWIGPLLEKAPYDPVRDFSPITLATRVPNILVVHPLLAVNSVRELIALAKAKPGELNYAATGIGSSSYLAAELFKSLSKVNIVQIPYKGVAQALNDLIGGRVQLMIPVAGAAAPHIKVGKLRALAIANAAPSALFPDLPTVAASGLPGYEVATNQGVFAPAKTPSSIINRLNREIVGILSRSDVKERFFNAGSDVVGSSSSEFSAKIKSDVIKWGNVIKDAGIRAD